MSVKWDGDGKAYNPWLDRNGRGICPGDLVRVGMRRGDHHGWTVERVGINPDDGHPVLQDVRTGEWMAWPPNNSLVELMTAEMEAEWRLSDSSDTRHCPHDGAKCHHYCGVGVRSPACHRKAEGMALSTPHAGYPLPGSE